jgi:hypothetical protein
MFVAGKLFLAIKKYLCGFLDRSVFCTFLIKISVQNHAKNAHKQKPLMSKTNTYKKTMLVDKNTHKENNHSSAKQTLTRKINTYGQKNNHKKNNHSSAK